MDPGPSSSQSSVLLSQSQASAATLTHYSTEPLTTGPDYDPLLLMLAPTGDVHPNPGPPRYPCSVFFKNVTRRCTSYLCRRCSHCVHSRCSGLRNVADYRRAHGWICTACRTPPQPRTPSPRPSPAHTPTISDKTFVSARTLIEQSVKVHAAHDIHMLSSKLTHVTSGNQQYGYNC